MLNNQVFYHGIIRKSIIAFGRLFSNIYIDRKQGDSVNGDTVQRIMVPLAYAPKEKWLVRVEQDPNLDNNTYTTLPRMSFEITGYNYDSTRKINKMSKIACHKDGQATEMFSPVPYNLDVSLYVLTKTQEDALQIIEQILPTFGPEYTLAIRAVPDMNIIQDIPVTLNSISVSDEYDGDFQTRRFVTHTLNFTLKTNLFGPVDNVNRIHTAIARVQMNEGGAVNAQYRADGDPANGAITDGWIEDL